ncbi:MAG: GNAT family N-acetyltransferase [candidate division WS1 bacterium]|jgi:GNAT superfamily N-acetyltransferase|nr:GNAT family N-acetyltransferase [candidate division WS1 bacterium]
MKNMLCREMLWPDEIGNMLSVRNAIFPPISEEDWLRYPSNTAAMAFLEGIPIGAIPLDQRRFQVAPGKVINTAFEHAVGTRADFRSRGVGNAIIDAARDFLADRAEALMVYRGGERSAGYRFYEKTGHVDLVYMRPLTWKLGDAGEADVAVGGIDDVIAAEADLLRVFDAAFGTYGGFVPREVGYWERALSEMIFTVIPSDILFIRYPAEGALEAYCIASVRTAARSDDSVRIMEIAGESDEAVREALRGICAEGVSRNLPVSTIACVDSPWRMLMREMGFEEGLRHTMIMGQTIAPARQFERVCADIDALAGLKVDIWAPGFEHTIYEAPDATRQITIEGKELLLQRMLMRRLDIRAAVASDLLTIANEERGDQDRLAAALPYCPWEYHWLDWT